MPRPIDADALKEAIANLIECQVNHFLREQMMRLVDDAPTLAPEPARTLSREDLKALPAGTVIWEERMNTETGEAMILPSLISSSGKTISDEGECYSPDVEYLFAIEEMRYRYWSSQPTNSQRREAPWA